MLSDSREVAKRQHENKVTDAEWWKLRWKPGTGGDAFSLPRPPRASRTSFNNLLESGTSQQILGKGTHLLDSGNENAVPDAKSFWSLGMRRKQTFDQQPPEFLATFSVFSPLARKAIVRLLFDGKILRENFKEVTEVVEQDFHWNLSGQL